MTEIQLRMTDIQKAPVFAPGLLLSGKKFEVPCHIRRSCLVMAM